MNALYQIVGIGEALIDIVGGERFLGGAPLNLAVHAHQLLTPLGGQGVIVSRIGQDATGDWLHDQLGDRGLPCDYLQRDPDRPTGTVKVRFDAAGNPNYHIAPDVAWDALQFDPELADLAPVCDAVGFGTLALRTGQTRNTIYRFLDQAPGAVRLLDVNLREDFDDPRSLARCLDSATLVKLGEEELPRVLRMLGLECPQGLPDQAQILRRKFQLDLTVITRGEHGTTAFSDAGQTDAEPAAYPPADGADPIGAGDACSAAILVGRTLNLPLTQTVSLANHAGAYVASQPGATPVLPESIVGMTAKSHGE